MNLKQREGGVRAVNGHSAPEQGNRNGSHDHLSYRFHKTQGKFLPVRFKSYCVKKAEGECRWVEAKPWKSTITTHDLAA